MVLRHIIVRLLAVFLIVGLVAAPLMTPAAAQQVAATTMSLMPSDMPCCPDGHAQDGCKDCPLSAMCTLTVVQAAAPDAIGMHVSFNVRQLRLAPDDVAVDSLIGAPPDHPPRLSI
jgi:hypothetical protein